VSTEYFLNYDKETQDNYNKRFKATDGLIRYVERDERNRDYVLWLFNQFKGDIDGVVLMAYMYAHMPIDIRKHHSILMLYSFKHAFAEGKINLTDESVKDIEKEYKRLWSILNEKG
jgi:hypothetical protein